ncbi:DUF805 domain-containing protein [Ligilactobacillus cholophilus]|uniref:DUF805 domain-containing protein n=1 Tax=Ligilactobacillus cholophilus TaxID=3050131 RepID=UPI0025B10323|nr:DUF805 domain-containing protein [Ligilactobacillus cholophilus]
MKIKQINENKTTSVKDILLDFWKGFISFNGKTTRKGFWIGLVEFLAVVILDFLIFGKLNYSYAGGVSGIIFSTFLYGIFLVMLIPLFALAFRRLRDAGMKTLLITILVVLTFAISVLCLFFPLPLIYVATIACHFFMIILLCIPTGAIK